MLCNNHTKIFVIRDKEIAKLSQDLLPFTFPDLTYFKIKHIPYDRLKAELDDLIGLFQPK